MPRKIRFSGFERSRTLHDVYSAQKLTTFIMMMLPSFVKVKNYRRFSTILLKLNTPDGSYLTCSKTGFFDGQLIIVTCHAIINLSPWQARRESEVTMPLQALPLDALSVLRTLESKGVALGCEAMPGVKKTFGLVRYPNITFG
jgi:hypothetical protein